MSDDIFIKKVKDAIRLSEKYHSPKFSKFLDEREQAVLFEEGIAAPAHPGAWGGHSPHWGDRQRTIPNFLFRRFGLQKNMIKN